MPKLLSKKAAAVARRARERKLEKIAKRQRKQDRIDRRSLNANADANATANPLVEVPPTANSNPPELDYEVYHSEEEPLSEASESASSSASDLSEPSPPNVGDDDKNLVDTDVKLQVGDDGKHPLVSEDVKPPQVGDDGKHHDDERDVYDVSSDSSVDSEPARSRGDLVVTSGKINPTSTLSPKPQQASAQKTPSPKGGQSFTDPKSQMQEQLAEAQAKVAQLKAAMQVEQACHLAAMSRAAQAPQKPTLRGSLQHLEEEHYAQRFEILVKSGWSMAAAHDGLQATMIDGKASVQRAQAHLAQNAQAEARSTLQNANDKLAEATDGSVKISETSALAKVLGEAPLAVDIILKLRDVHSRTRAKNAHSAKPALCAANLVEMAAVKNDTTTARFGYAFLCKIASAVSEDCTQCKALRDKLEQEETWKSAAAKAAEDKALRALEAKRVRESAGKTRERADGFLQDLPFKLGDSKRVVTKRHGDCAFCKQGNTGCPSTKWLLFCQQCDKGYHSHCTEWKLVRNRMGAEIYTCRPCLDTHEYDFASGATKDFWQTLEGGHKGIAPDHAAASETESTPSSAPLSNMSDLSSLGLATVTPPQTPTRPATTPSGPPTGSTPSSKEADTTFPQQSVLTTGTKIHTAKANISVKDYIIWDPVPDDWVRKPEARTAEHPEKGYGKEAYNLWRKRNVTLRDSVKSSGSNLGPLTRAFSPEMKVTIGTQLLMENSLPGLWERDPSMSQQSRDKWIDAWIDSKPDFAWFDEVSDEALLSVMDKKFGVKSSTAFLSKRFPSNLLATNSHGEINYHEAEFNRWATSWLADLRELTQSGCDFSGTDLHRTLLNALASNKTIWNEASRHVTRSPHVLISFLREWLRTKDQAAQEARNEKEALKCHESVDNPKGALPVDSHTAIALLTQTVSQLAQQMAQGGGQAVPSSSDEKQLKPLAAHLKACKDTGKAKCNGCGNVWDRKRPIPCFYACKFTEHPHYNSLCSASNFLGKDPLTWKDFKKKHPGVPVPSACVAYEKREESFNAQKRKREETASKA